MQQQEPKRYKLNISDILQIPEDRFDDFLFDLKKWHKAVKHTVDMLDAVAKASYTSKTYVKPEMVWIDDGKHEGKIIIKGKE